MSLVSRPFYAGGLCIPNLNQGTPASVEWFGQLGSLAAGPAPVRHLPGTAVRRSVMLIRIGYQIDFEIPVRVAMVTLLHVHPSRAADLRSPDELRISPPLAIDEYIDSFGNLCSRFLAPAGQIQLSASALIEDSGLPDPIDVRARQSPVEDLPHEVLRFLLAS